MENLDENLPVRESIDNVEKQLAQHEAKLEKAERAGDKEAIAYHRSILVAL